MMLPAWREPSRHQVVVHEVRERGDHAATGKRCGPFAALRAAPERPLVDRGPEHARAFVDDEARNRMLRVDFTRADSLVSPQDMARGIDGSDGIAMLPRSAQRRGGERRTAHYRPGDERVAQHQATPARPQSRELERAARGTAGASPRPGGADPRVVPAPARGRPRCPPRCAASGAQAAAACRGALSPRRESARALQAPAGAANPRGSPAEAPARPGLPYRARW